MKIKQHNFTKDTKKLIFLPPRFIHIMSFLKSCQIFNIFQMARRGEACGAFCPAGSYEAASKRLTKHPPITKKAAHHLDIFQVRLWLENPDTRGQTRVKRDLYRRRRRSFAQSFYVTYLNYFCRPQNTVCAASTAIKMRRARERKR